MEGLAHLVDESLIRHGFEPSFDHRRLQWSRWFPCHNSLSILLAPCKPGLFALGEEVIPPGELAVGEGKRMLALFQISEATDLGMALGRLFLSANPARERLASGRCFARYVAVEDPAQRRTAYTALQRWMASSAQPAEADAHNGGFVSGHDFSRAASAAIRRAALAAEPGDASPRPSSSNNQARIGPLLPIPSSF